MTNYDYGWRKVFLIKILLLLPSYYWEILQILKVTHYLSHTTAALARQSASVGVLVLTIDLRPWSFYPSSNFPLFFSLSAHLLTTTTLAFLRVGLGAVGFFPPSSFLGKKTCLPHSPLLLLFCSSLWFIYFSWSAPVTTYWIL